MAANPLPTKLNELFTKGEDMADGAATHGTAIGLMQNTEERIRSDTLTAREAESAFQQGKTAKLALTTAQTVADSNAKSFLAKARLVLTTFLGNLWSEAWAETGFPNQSTAVPATIVERQSLLASLQLYFAEHTAQQNSPLGVTAAAAGTLFTALSNARSAVNAGITDQAQRKIVRDNAEKALRARLTGLIGELGQLLPGDDPLWYAFGLVPPDSDDAPDQVSGLIATPNGPGVLLVDWADAPRAASYWVEIQIVGVDASFHRVQTVYDSDATLTGLPSGATVRIRIISVSSDGKTSPPSDIIEVVVL